MEKIHRRFDNPEGIALRPASAMDVPAESTSSLPSKRIERRQWPRYPVRLRMYIVRIGTDAVLIPTLTYNLSRAGVLFHLDRKLDEGVTLEYVIEFSPTVRLNCCGQVVRCSLEASAGMDVATIAAAATLDLFETTRQHSAQRGAAGPSFSLAP